MTVHIALLRAVNLGAHGKVAMPELRDVATGLGFKDARTLLQSGNLVFQSEDSGNPAELERLLAAEAEKRLKLRTDFFVRTAKEWAAVIAANPFPGAAKDDPSHLVVMALKDRPDGNALEALRSAIKGNEQVEVKGRQAYITYPDGIGRSKLTTALIEAKLGSRGTGRNWNTVLKLGEMAKA